MICWSLFPLAWTSYVLYKIVSTAVDDHLFLFQKIWRIIYLFILLSVPIAISVTRRQFKLIVKSKYTEPRVNRLFRNGFVFGLLLGVAFGIWYFVIYYETLGSVTEGVEIFFTSMQDFGENACVLIYCVYFAILIVTEKKMKIFELAEGNDVEKLRSKLLHGDLWVSTQGPDPPIASFV